MEKIKSSGDTHAAILFPRQQNKKKIDPPDAKAAPHNFIQKNQSTGVSSAHPKIPCTGSKSLIQGKKNQITRGHPRRDFIRQAAKQKRLIDWLIRNFIPSAENTAQQFTHATPTLVGRGSGPKPAPTPANSASMTIMSLLRCARLQRVISTFRVSVINGSLQLYWLVGRGWSSLGIGSKFT